MTDNLAQDLVVAAARVVDRSGGSGFEIGATGDERRPAWYASAYFKGTRIIAEGHKTPTGAALELAEKLIDGGSCRCGKTATLNDQTPGCRWRLIGDRWTPGCDADPVPFEGNRGDIPAMRDAYRHRYGKEPN